MRDNLVASVKDGKLLAFTRVLNNSGDELDGQSIEIPPTKNRPLLSLEKGPLPAFGTHLNPQGNGHPVLWFKKVATAEQATAGRTSPMK